MQMWDSHWHLSEAISKGDSSTGALKLEIKSNYDEIHSIMN